MRRQLHGRAKIAISVEAVFAFPGGIAGETGCVSVLRDCNGNTLEAVSPKAGLAFPSASNSFGLRIGGHLRHRPLRECSGHSSRKRCDQQGCDKGYVPPVRHDCIFQIFVHPKHRRAKGGSALWCGRMDDGCFGHRCPSLATWPGWASLSSSALRDVAGSAQIPSTPRQSGRVFSGRLCVAPGLQWAVILATRIGSLVSDGPDVRTRLPRFLRPRHLRARRARHD